MDQKILEQFRAEEYATSTPQLKDLHNHITPHYAARWRVIGTLLGIHKGRLDIIEHDYYHKAEPCCNAVLEEWLEVKPSAVSWNNLLSVIQSPAVSSDQAAEKAVLGEDLSNKIQPDMDKLTEEGAISILSNRVAMTNEHAQFRANKDTWPPDQPHRFTPLLLVHHEGQQRTDQDQAIEAAKMVHKYDNTLEKLPHIKLSKHAPHASKVTKEVTEILNPLEKSNEPEFIMIDGAPGIGKSVLLREIACRWGKKQLLRTFTLVLLVCLRDPIVQQATSISDLLLPFCRGDRRAKEIANKCSDYLITSGGKNLLFLLDGFDEYPQGLRESIFIDESAQLSGKPKEKCNLIGDIIIRNILPLCGLVVTSRPHASVALRGQSTVKVDILGFTEEERHHYIEQSLEKEPQSIEKLTHYLQDHLTISNLCLVPFNIVILLYLYKMGIPLPSDSTRLYHHFICLTICRHLAKSGHPLKNDIKELADLPEPYSIIVQQISKLALQTLNNNQLVFTSDDVKSACPDVITTPEAINGFGLLQAVQHYSLTGITMTFNFLHLTIQEYLAAHYIVTGLQPAEELRLLHKQFWSNLHTNMFTIYISLTKGQRLSLKKFLFGGDSQIAISSQFLCDNFKAIRLFHCFKKAQDVQICKSIEEAEIFNERAVDLNNIRLSATDLECVSLFLTSSSYKQWVKLNLWNCYIQDRGLHIIYRFSKRSDITITALSLFNNGLTRSSSSIISHIVLNCKVEVLSISGNHTVGESKDLYIMVAHPSSMLTRLYMSNTSLSSIAASALFTAVKDSNMLKMLHIDNNAITGDAAKDIIAALAVNKSLVKLWINDNPFSEEAIVSVLNGLRSNNTLQVLRVSSHSPNIKDRIRSIEAAINSKRNNQGIRAKLIVY